MGDIVIDASATIAWLFNEHSGDTWLDAHIDTASLVAPSLWRLEVLNTVLVGERRGKITQPQSAEFFESLRLLNITIMDGVSSRSLEEFASFARPHQLTAYDAAYLDLAETLKLPLYTFDKNLRDAAVRLGIILID